jgi:hypothetical protein
MGSADPEETCSGRLFRVRYRKVDHLQIDKRGFRTEREAELFRSTVKVAKSRGAVVDPPGARVPLSDWLERGPLLVGERRHDVKHSQAS